MFKQVASGKKDIPLIMMIFMKKGCVVFKLNSNNRKGPKVLHKGRKDKNINDLSLRTLRNP